MWTTVKNLILLGEFTMSINVNELIDYYINKYLKEKEHNTDRYVLVGMLEGLITICRFCGISDKDLGKERLKKICTGKIDEAGI